MVTNGAQKRPASQIKFQLMFLAKLLDFQQNAQFDSLDFSPAKFSSLYSLHGRYPRSSGISALKQTLTRMSPIPGDASPILESIFFIKS